MRNNYAVRWAQIIGMLGLAVAMGASASAKSTRAATALEMKSAQTKIIRHWQNSFRALKTLDCRWQMKGNFTYQPSVQHTFDYRFLWDGARFRLNTSFSSTKPKEKGDYQSTIHAFDGKFYRNLNTIVSGSRMFGLQLKPVQPVNPYNVLLPIINSFIFVFDDERFAFSIESLQKDTVWQNFEKRIQSIERGTWQKRNGFWLTIGYADKQRQLKVFVDDKNCFPIFFSGRNHVQLQKKNDYRDEAFDYQVAQTMNWRSGSETYIFPTKSISRGWTKSVSEGVVTRTQTQIVEEATAPVKVNQPLDAARFTFEIPAKTLVYYTPNADTTLDDVYPFYYDPNGGSLWAQEQRERKRVVAAKKRIAALPKIYDEKADGKTQIENALAQAKAENKRVLLQFGANWCFPCHILHDILQNDAAVAAILQKEYVTVSIDLNGNHNSDVAEQYRSAQQEGIPFVVVLNAEGQRLVAPPYNALATADKLDAKKIAVFLQSCSPQ
jgi:thiol-disulfide isomerase/thioredoxin